MGLTRKQRAGNAIKQALEFASQGFQLARQQGLDESLQRYREAQISNLEYEQRIKQRAYDQLVAIGAIPPEGGAVPSQPAGVLPQDIIEQRQQVQPVEIPSVFEKPLTLSPQRALPPPDTSGLSEIARGGVFPQADTGARMHTTPQGVMSIPPNVVGGEPLSQSIRPPSIQPPGNSFNPDQLSRISQIVSAARPNAPVTPQELQSWPEEQIISAISPVRDPNDPRYQDAATQALTMRRMIGGQFIPPIGQPDTPRASLPSTDPRIAGSVTTIPPLDMGGDVVLPDKPPTLQEPQFVRPPIPSQPIQVDGTGPTVDLGLSGQIAGGQHTGPSAAQYGFHGPAVNAIAGGGVVPAQQMQTVNAGGYTNIPVLSGQAIPRFDYGPTARPFSQGGWVTHPTTGAALTDPQYFSMANKLMKAAGMDEQWDVKSLFGDYPQENPAWTLNLRTQEKLLDYGMKAIFDPDTRIVDINMPNGLTYKAQVPEHMGDNVNFAAAFAINQMNWGPQGPGGPMYSVHGGIDATELGINAVNEARQRPDGMFMPGSVPDVDLPTGPDARRTVTTFTTPRLTGNPDLEGLTPEEVLALPSEEVEHTFAPVGGDINQASQDVMTLIDSSNVRPQNAWGQQTLTLSDPQSGTLYTAKAWREFPPQDRRDLYRISQAMKIIDGLGELAIGRFSQSELTDAAGIIQRMMTGAEQSLDAYMGLDPDLRRYVNGLQWASGLLATVGGESGSRLSDRDREYAMRSMPIMNGLFPATQREAVDQLNMVWGLLDGYRQSIMFGIGYSPDFWSSEPIPPSWNQRTPAPEPDAPKVDGSGYENRGF